MALYDTDDEQEKVVLVGVELNPLDDCEKSLEELAELAKTAGAVTVGKMFRNLQTLQLVQLFPNKQSKCLLGQMHVRIKKLPCLRRKIMAFHCGIPP